MIKISMRACSPGTGSKDCCGGLGPRDLVLLRVVSGERKVVIDERRAILFPTTARNVAIHVVLARSGCAQRNRWHAPRFRLKYRRHRLGFCVQPAFDHPNCGVFNAGICTITVRTLL